MKGNKDRSDLEKHTEELKGKHLKDKEMNVAVIGMACRFPGGRNYDEFWQNLKQGRSSIQEIPRKRWDWKAFWGDPKNEINKSNSKWGGFIESVGDFDAEFFSLSPREVEAMDPQQRIMLELTWNCLENAGICPSKVSGKNVGVYIGVFNFDYKELQEKEYCNIEAYHSTGTASALIANRISHYFNLKGASIPIDTACSSSLFAIHSAIQSLNAEECDMALAGGINLLLTPSRHISFSKTGMLSSTGACRTFDENADGYVRSEGAGIILLKPLEKALADGNTIHGILKGSAVNHSGKTHTLTYPNADAQADVIVAAYQRAGIAPKSISYIEAHGTGTPKGDPIEFQGLLKAFERFPEKKDGNTKRNYCGLGSLKTNVGHLEAAAGIAGVIKVLLAMKYQQLPGLQNFKKLNQRISIDNSPFYLVDRLQEWKTPKGKNKQYIPRRAGISSFGFGGANAHVVMEEAPAISKKANSILPYYLICLTAKSEKSLRQKEKDLLNWLKRKGKQYQLTDISMTLIFGREHFDLRSAFVIKDKPELQEKLEQVSAKGYAEGYFKDNNILQDKTIHPFLVEFGKTIIEKLRTNKMKNEQEYGHRLNALAQVYVNGYNPEWNTIFNEEILNRVNLPTYPFDGERYWISANKTETHGQITRYGMPVVLHPLLQQNTSNLNEQRFSSTFTGREFFLADHIVKKKRVLPGAAYLEMARAAVEQATGDLKFEQTGIQLKNVIWARPIVVGDQPVKVHIGIYLEDNDELSFKVYGKRVGNSDEPIIYSQGRAVLDAVNATPTLDLARMKASCGQVTLSAVQCYEAFKKIGLEYGPGHRGIERVYIGKGQLLAKLSLPSIASETKDQFTIHPCMLDSAIQASLFINSKEIKLSLPFALKKLEVIGKCASEMWAFIRTSADSNAKDMLQKVDINLYDGQGNIFVGMKALTFRMPEEELDSAGIAKTPGVMMLKPCWKEQGVAAEAKAPQYARRLVLLGGIKEVTPEKIEKKMAGTKSLALKSLQDGIVERTLSYSVQTFEEIRNILKDKLTEKYLLQIIFCDQDEQIFSGLSGLLNTAHLENPKFIGQLIEIESNKNFESILAILNENSLGPIDCRIRYQNGKRYVADWSEIKACGQETVPWKERGVYLITGGVGGLGIIFAKEIADKIKKATLILIGRSILDEGTKDRLKELEKSGTRIVYRQADVCDEKAVTGLIRNIKKEYGNLHGVIHSAGVIQDNFIIKKTNEEFLEVLAPKVKGLVNIDQATKDLPIDFFILFSSVASTFGNAGQADYAAANAFMDAYARHRYALVASRQRKGLTLSINWPLWKDGGMHIDTEAEKIVAQNTGMVAMQTATGIKALYQGLASGNEQVLVLEGDLEQIRTTLLGHSFESKTAKAPASIAEDFPLSVDHSLYLKESSVVPAVAYDLFQEKAIDYFKEQFSTAIKKPAHRIEANAPLEKYGINSIMVMQLTNQLEKTFGSLSKTLFFEYQNIEELTGYFLKAHRDQLKELLGYAENVEPDSGDSKENAAVTEVEKSIPGSRRRRFSVFRAKTGEEKKSSDIAIVGVSGRYPQAKNIHEFWKNLKNGKDCITEIPASRWDYRLYFDEDKNRPGKTYCKWGGFLDGVDRFDPSFFNISPREAAIIDPQERLFLECVYATLEDAGYTRESLAKHRSFSLKGNIGVYVGVMYEEYQLYAACEQLQGRPVALWGIPSSIANRVSYFFNFHGPSMAVDTMCSSSLTAIHLACQSLQQGDCKLAIAGGVNVSIHPNKYLFLSQGKFVSGKGRCESFGKGGNGYVPGEGVGAVLLKPLDRAIDDGDHIYGILKATAVNHGGKTNGYTVPNPKAQAGAIGQAIQRAKIDPRTMSYIEAHGTGTSLGDPIEITGLTRAFEQYTKDKQFCAIGSVKSNIGHCESAAGIAGVTKVLLQFKHGQLAPSLHAKVLNPNIDFGNTPFVVQQELMEWNRPTVENNGKNKEYPRIAGVSAFGAGGSNAHVIIEEYVIKRPLDNATAITIHNPVMIVLSAKNEDRLQARAQQLITAIEEGQFVDNNLADMAYTLQIGREAMQERLGVIVASLKELKEKLKSFMEGREAIENLYRGQVKHNKETLAVFTADVDLQKAIDSWISKRKYAKLLDFWVKGLVFDWNKLYDDKKPSRISLPSYPFAKKRYWVSDTVTRYEKETTTASAVKVAVKPLPLKNASHVLEQRFDSNLTCDKPNGISLRSITDGSKAPITQTQQSTAISLASAPLSQPEHTFEAEPERQVQTVVSAESLRTALQASLAESLYMSQEEVDVDTKFVDMGLDSIIGVEWIKTINKRYNTSIPATKVYDYPTIREFVGFFEKELQEQIRPVPVNPVLPAPSRRVLKDLPPIKIEAKPRFQESAKRRSKADSETTPQRADIVKPGGHYGLVLSTVRSINELALKPWVLPEPQKNEISVQVKASAINFPDVMCVKGLYPTMPDYPFIPGFEISGVVTKRGDQAIGFNLGDEVMALTGKQMGGHAGFVNVPVTNAVPKPKKISFEEACSMPVVFLTVHHAFKVGKLAPKEHVLIQTASGGCGLMAIQLAQLKGCVCYGTSSKQEKLALLKKLQILHTINYQNGEFDRKIKKTTNNRGVDVVLNTLSGDHIQKGLNCLAPSGRYLEIAVHALKTSPKLDLSKLVQNQSIYSIDIRRLILEERLEVNEALNLMSAMLQAEEIVPIVSRIYPVEQIKEALEYVGRGRHIGKVVISHTRKTMIDLSDDCIQRLIGQKQKCEKRTASIKATFQVKQKKEPEIVKEKIAVIGMAGKFPQAETIEAFWENLVNGRDCISKVPATRWSLDEYYNPDPKAPGKTNCQWMGTLEDADKFDPRFFSISPAEAEVMDPQQRLFLENSWRCIEDAGLNPVDLSGNRCGVFVGCAANDYGQSVRGREQNAQGLMGGASSILSARISYLLNLNGPCLAIDTACSSSLVAITEACNSLILGTSDMALAGGVNVMAGPAMHIMTSKAGMLSPDGRCFSFDDRANGFVPGEGVGVVLLKRLYDAVRDDDPIYGLIVGWGINQDGKTNGITAPSVNSQIALEKDVYERFKIDPGTISLAEAHGTGTKLGDPVEVEALTDSFRAYTEKRNYCALGTVKSNIGHLLAASGVSGAIKILLALKHRMLPPLIHYKTLNEHIRLKDSPFYINTDLKSWEVDSGVPRRACVSSFGFSGTNAHVVMEEYIPSDFDQPLLEINSSRPAIILLSARNENRLYAQTRQLLAGIQEGKLNSESLSDLAYTLQIGREAMEERLALMVSSIVELEEKLESFMDGENDIEKLYRGQVKRNKEDMALFEEDEELEEAVEKWIRRGKYHKLLGLWVKGLVIDWNKLYDGIKPRRISLPGYPFARERYWISEFEGQKQVNIPETVANAGGINPLLRQNTSDFLEHKFTSTFTGDEGALPDLFGNLMLQPVWKEQALSMEMTAPFYEQYLVMLCEPDEITGKRITGNMNGVNCHILRSDEKEVEKRFLIYAQEVFETIRNFLKDQSKDGVLIQIVVPFQGQKRLFSGLLGLLKTARLENPKIWGQLIEVEPETPSERIIAILNENRLSPTDEYIRYQKGKRMLIGWRELETSQEEVSLPWKDRGNYLITGGTGGLGLIFAKEIAQKTKNAALILTGRSPLNADKQTHLEELASLGARIDYREVDVTQKEEVGNLIWNIQKNFGSLSGIIHAAGELKDNFIIKKTRKELQAVLAPKVTGLINLDQASRKLPLDFFVFFSSIAGVMGNIGQADYAAANAFMDAYAGYRNTLVAAKQRKGATLSINWPLWQEGGMQIDGQTEKAIRQSTGMFAMRTATGIQAFYQGLTAGKDQVMVMEGELSKMNEYLSGAPSKVHAKSLRRPAVQVDPEQLLEKTVERLKNLFSEITKLSADQIDEDESLATYGIDSTMITRLNQKLGGVFGELPKTLFFEYQTLNALSECFIADYPDECARWTGFSQQERIADKGLTGASCFDNRRFELTSFRPGAKQPRVYAVASEGNGVREPIAIVGMSGRYPQAKNLQEYWENLKKGKDCITEIPGDRWNLDDFYHPDSKEAADLGKSYCKRGGFMDGFADFDPLFFNLSPREASNIDPQERLLIETCWEALEDAGYTKEQIERQYQRRIGVFVGITKTGFNLYGPDLWKHGEKVFPHTSFGSAANRISFLLNLQGPSMPIDTMCSSSLIAIHEACTHLLHDECEMAIAGGVNLYLHPANYFQLSIMQMLSTDGQCRSFGKGANGFVPGEGVGCVLLKRLPRAIADGDHIYAVIRGSGVNHGGKTNGYTVPNPCAQRDVIRAALDSAGIDARTISYIEAHGTGTLLGDPIEITGLTQAFCKDTPDKGFCALGSVKSNIGHLEAAAGISGLTKIILQMKHQKYVPSLHSQELNPNINFEQTPFWVQQEVSDWKRPVIEVNGQKKRFPRRAGISSFGAGGANAHLVIEEFIPKNQKRISVNFSKQNPAIIVVSARNEERLKKQVTQLLTKIQSHSHLNLSNMAYTLQVGREAMEERLGLIVESVAELEEKFKAFLTGQERIDDLYRGQVKSRQDPFATLVSDEDMSSIITTWISKGKYSKLLNFWVKGVNCDWKRLYGDTKPQRMSLPTYPFAKNRYWIKKIDEMNESTLSRQKANQKSDAFYENLLDEVIDDKLSVDDAVSRIASRIAF